VEVQSNHVARLIAQKENPPSGHKSPPRNPVQSLSRVPYMCTNRYPILKKKEVEYRFAKIMLNSKKIDSPWYKPKLYCGAASTAKPGEGSGQVASSYTDNPNWTRKAMQRRAEARIRILRRLGIYGLELASFARFSCLSFSSHC
jgi:hypothetical protein